MRSGTLVELELEGQLNIVRHRIVHVVIERVVENGRVCILDLSVTKVKTIPIVVKISVLSGYLRRIRTCSRLVCQIDSSMWVVQESAEVSRHPGRSPMSSRTLSGHLPELEEHSASVQTV